MSIKQLLAAAGVGFFSAAGVASAQVTIAQIYGGNTTATTAGSWRYDYVVLKNKTNAPIDLAAGGYILQYASATGNFSTTTTRTVLTGVIPANGYFLIQQAGAASGNVLPLTPDQIGTINLSGTTGKLMLSKNGFGATTASAVTCPIPNADVIDFVGYGTANCFESTVAPAPSATTTLFRASDGCTDTDNNSSDFSASSADSTLFRNTSSAGSVCVATDANLSVGLTPSRLCEVATGPAQQTFTVTVNNADGGITATGASAVITLPTQFTYASGIPSQGVVTPGSGTATWSIGTLAAGASATLTFAVDIAGSGTATTTVAVSAIEPDPNSANNSASRTNEIAASVTPLLRPFLSNLPTAPLAVRQFAVPAGGNRSWSNSASGDVYSRFGGSADGTKFAFVGALDAGDPTTDRAVFIGSASGASPTFTAVIQKGFTPLDGVDNVGATIDPIAVINNAGQVGFSGVASPATTLNDYVARRNANGTIDTLVREGASVPVGVVGPATWGTSNHVTSIQNSGAVAFFSTVAGGDVSGTTNESLVGVATDAATVSVTARKGVTNVDGSGVPLGDSATWKFFDTAAAFGYETGFFTTANGATWMAAGTINTSPTSTANDNVLVRNGASLFQEARELPAPAPFPGGLAGTTFLKGWQMDGDGDWVAYGSNAEASPNDWVIKNGQVFTRTNDPITTSNTETWSDTSPLSPGGTTGYADCFFSVYTSGTDTLVGGVSNNVDARRNGVLVWNNTQVIVREGDPVDVNQNGLDDDSTYVDIFRNGRMWIDAQRRAYIGVTTRSSNGACGTPVSSGQAILLVQLPAIGPVACGPSDVAGPNQSLGADGALTADDIIVFLGWFFASDVRADVAGANQSTTPDGSFTADDIIVFLGRYFAGC